MRGYRWLTVTAIAVVLVGSYALAHGPNERHQGDPNSPSDIMMEQCTTMGMGPEGHTIAGRMTDQMHGEGTHHRMQGDMMMGDGMMGMMHRGMGNGGHHGMMMGHADAAERPLTSIMLQNRGELGLTPEQIQKLETLRLDFRRASIKRSADLQVAELELAELRKKQPVDLARVEAQVKRIETLRTEQRLSRIMAIEKGKTLLTPEQQKKLDTLGQRAGGGHATGMTGCPMMTGGMGGTMGPSGK